MIGIKHRLKIAIGQCKPEEDKIATHRRASSTLLASLTLNNGIKSSSQPTLVESCGGHNSHEGASQPSSAGVRSRASKERCSSSRIKSLINRLETAKDASRSRNASVSRSISHGRGKSMAKPDIKLASTLKDGVFRQQTSSQLNIFARTTSMGNMGDIFKSSAVIRKKVTEKLNNDQKRSQNINQSYQRHRRMLSAIDKNSTEFDSYFRTTMYDEGPKTSRRPGVFATHEDKENHSFKANICHRDKDAKKSKSKEIQRHFTKSLLKGALGKFGTTKTEREEENQGLLREFGRDGPSEMPEFPAYLKDLGMDFEVLKRAGKSQPCFIDLTDLFAGKIPEEKTEKPAFTFNNDILSKKNSIITFKDDYSNEKNAKMTGSSAGRMYNLKSQEKRFSEEKSKISLNPEGQQQYSRHPKSKLPLISSLNDDITDLSALDSRLNWPACRPGDQTSALNKPSIPSGLASFIEGRLDDSNDGQKNMKIFESTESLLLKIHREFNREHQENDPGQPDIQSFAMGYGAKMAERMANSRYISPPNTQELKGIKKNDSDSINVQSSKTMRRAVDSFTSAEKEIVCRNFQLPPAYNNRLVRPGSKIDLNAIHRAQPEIITQGLPELPELISIYSLNIESKLIIRKHMSRFKKSNGKRLQDFEEIDTVSSILPRVKIEAPDLTRIESADYHRAVSIDDRDLKSMLCLKSIDFARRASKDLHDNLLMIDKNYEKDSSMINDASIKRPPRAGSKSQRTFVQDDVADISMSPRIARKKGQGDKLYKSGSNIPLDRMDDSDQVIPQSEKISDKKLTHLKKKYIPLIQETAESSADTVLPLLETFHLTPALECIASVPSNFAHITTPKLTKSSTASKQPNSHSTASIRKHVKSTTDTYYLSSDCTSVVKTKSSNRLFSGLQASDNHPWHNRDVTKGESKESDYSFHNLNSSSGLHRPFLKHAQGPEFCSELRIGGEPQSDKVKVFKREDHDRGSKTMRFNFFSCTNSANTSERKPLTSDIHRLVQEIRDIRKIPEVDESKISIDQRMKKISPSSLDIISIRSVSLKPLKACDPSSHSAICLFLPSTSQLDFLKNEISKYKSLARSNRSFARSHSRKNTEQCMSQRTSTKRVSFGADLLKSQSRSRLDSARDAYKIEGSTYRIPRLALDKLPMNTSSKESSGRLKQLAEVKSQATNTQNTSELFANILESYLDTDGNLEYSAKENEYFTKVINSGYQSSRLHCKSNPNLSGSQFRNSANTGIHKGLTIPVLEDKIQENIESLFGMFT